MNIAPARLSSRRRALAPGGIVVQQIAVDQLLRNAKKLRHQLARLVLGIAVPADQPGACFYPLGATDKFDCLSRKGGRIESTAQQHSHIALRHPVVKCLVQQRLKPLGIALCRFEKDRFSQLKPPITPG